MLTRHERMAGRRDRRRRNGEKTALLYPSLQTTRMTRWRPRRRFSFRSLRCQFPRRRRTRRHSEPGRPWRAAAGRIPARAGATLAPRSRARPRAGTRTGRSTRPCTPPPPPAPPLASRPPPPPPAAAGGSPSPPPPPLLALCRGHCFPRLRPSRRVSASGCCCCCRGRRVSWVSVPDCCFICLCISRVTLGRDDDW